MLKVEKIIFKDINENTYTIEKHQLEQFPLIGGDSANMITTQVWNQHGNNFIDSYMESFDGELIFALYIADKTDQEQEQLRRELTNILNPLNGTLQMQVHLNTAKIYNRDITIIAAPSFPTGFENRNEVWQKVQISYTANNPFWYAEEELVETFQAVEPLFLFPFTMTGTQDAMLLDYVGKKTASTVENPHIAYRLGTSETLVIPNVSTMTELDDTDTLTGYPVIATIGGTTTLAQTAGLHATLKRIAQHLFSFNILAAIERKYGAAIWEGAATTAAKITVAKAMITKTRATISGYGTSPTGNKANFALWNKTTAAWVNTVSHTNAVLTELTLEATDLTNFIDDNGFIHYLHYSNAADAATNAVIRADYIKLVVNTTLDENLDPVYMGSILPSNIAVNSGQVAAPVVIKIVGACVNPRIDNESTGEFIKFKNLTMVATDTLEIDTTFGQKKVLLNGQNVFNKLDFSSTFFNLKIGENLIEFTDDTGSTTATIHFIYRNLFITV